MIFQGNSKFENVREKALGGQGTIVGRHPFKPADRPEATRFKMIGEMTLAAGSSIGYHVHEKDEEIYIIVSGRGQYTDNDKKTYPVAPGDVTMTRQGEGHGLANDGGEPLVFTAVVVD